MKKYECVSDDLGYDMWLGFKKTAAEWQELALKIMWQDGIFNEDDGLFFEYLESLNSKTQSDTIMTAISDWWRVKFALVEE